MLPSSNSSSTYPETAPTLPHTGRRRHPEHRKLVSQRRLDGGESAIDDNSSDSEESGGFSSRDSPSSSLGAYSAIAASYNLQFLRLSFQEWKRAARLSRQKALALRMVRRRSLASSFRAIRGLFLRYTTLLRMQSLVKHSNLLVSFTFSAWKSWSREMRDSHASSMAILQQRVQENAQRRAAAALALIAREALQEEKLMESASQYWSNNALRKCVGHWRVVADDTSTERHFSKEVAERFVEHPFC